MMARMYWMIYLVALAVVPAAVAVRGDALADSPVVLEGLPEDSVVLAVEVVGEAAQVAVKY